MRTSREPRCPVCQSAGTLLYAHLRDGLYGAPETWQMQRCGSAQCGALWLDPFPHPEDIFEAYANYYTHTPSRDDAPGFRGKVRDAFAARALGYASPHRFTERLASWLYWTSPRRYEWALYKRFYLPWTPSGRLLEVGCGSGSQLAQMARAGWHATGLDFDPNAVAAARERGLSVALGDLRDARYPESSFDAIVMTHVIEHVLDPVGLLAECARILVPNGTVVMVTPNPGSLGHRIYGRFWRGLEPPRHLVVFPPRSMRLACTRAGLEISRTIYSARDAANLFLSSERLRDLNDRERIRLPESAVSPPWRLRVLEDVERLGCWFGMQWGEEQVVLAHPTKRAGPKGQHG